MSDGARDPTRENPPSVSALYLHVPFCARRCLYCDFPTRAARADDELLVAYARALRLQLAELTSLGLLEGVRTAYLGGGTPSFLGPKTLGSLVATVHRACPALAELSCEANPDSLGDELLAKLADGGVTRVSVGVQSLDDAELAALGRAHGAPQARERLSAAVKSGLLVSCDLMCAIPLQTERSWRATLAGVIDAGVGHVSVYPLQIEESSAFGRRYVHAEAAFNDPDVQAARMLEAEGALGAAGLVRYEVASYARPGEACAHNLAYWTGRPYLGLGTGAAGMLDARGYARLSVVAPQLPKLPANITRVRLTVTSSPRAVALRPRLRDLSCDLEFLTADQALCEDLMLAARTSAGLGAPLLERARERLGARRLDACLGRVLRRGLVTSRPDGALAPTRRGWLQGNELYGELWGLHEGEVLGARC